MASHLSDIGFKKIYYNNYLKKYQEIIDMYKDKSIYNLDKNGNGYVLVRINKVLELYWKVNNGCVDKRSLSIHHNNDSIISVNSFKYERNNKCVASIDDIVVRFDVPCRDYIIEYNPNNNYKCQLSFYVQWVDIYKDASEYEKTPDYLDNGLRNICTDITNIDSDTYEESRSSICLITGIVKEIRALTNPYKDYKYFEVVIDSYKVDYICYFDCDDYKDLCVGNVIDGEFYVTGKIEKV